MDKFVPKSVLERLVVGQRVRYVPNYECKRLPTIDSLGHSYGAELHEIYLDAEYKTGIIVSTSNSNLEGHPYVVQVDDKYRFGGEEFNAMTLAADELALVEPNIDA